MLEGLVADCQRAGAALSLLTVGRRESGGAASFGLHLAFASDGRPASLGRVHDVLPRTGTNSRFATACGTAVLHRDLVIMAVPGTAEVVSLSSMQVFLPIPSSTWTVVLSTASAFAELTGQLEEMLMSVAESISIGDVSACTDGDDRAGINRAGDDEPVEQWVPAEGRAAEPGLPGFERGFGTLVRRRIGDKEVAPGHEGGPEIEERRR